MLAVSQEKIKITIINLLGEVIFFKEYFNIDNQLKEKIELDHAIAPGMYTLKASVGDKIEKTSIILSK